MGNMGEENPNLILSAWLRQLTASMKLPAAGTRRAATVLPELRDSHQDPPLLGSDSRGLCHQWSLLGARFCRSCRILPDVPAHEEKRSSPIALPRFTTRGWVEGMDRSVQSSASHRRRRHDELCWRWLQVLAASPATRDGRAPGSTTALPTTHARNLTETPATPTNKIYRRLLTHLAPRLQLRRSGHPRGRQTA